jgi:hypothetical protein
MMTIIDIIWIWAISIDSRFSPAGATTLAGHQEEEEEEEGATTISRW